MTIGKEPPVDRPGPPTGAHPASLRKPFANKAIGEVWMCSELDEWDRLRHEDPQAAEALLNKKTEEALARNAAFKTMEPKPPTESSEEEIVDSVILAATLCGGDEYTKQVLVHGQFDEHSDAHFTYNRPLRKYPQQEAERLVADLRPGYKVDSLRTYRDTEGKPLQWVIKAKHPDSGEIEILPMRRINDVYELKEPEWGAKRPLYGQHDLKLTSHTSPVDGFGIIVSDEWSAEALIELGLPATTSGNGPVEGVHWDKIGRGEIIIWPDNNEAGIKYANDVAGYLCGGFCQKLQKIDIASLNLPKKGNCLDWIETIRKQHDRAATVEDFLKLPRIDLPNDYPEENDTSESPASVPNQMGEVKPMGAGPLPETGQAEILQKNPDDERIKWLASLKPFEYDRRRHEEAADMGCRVTVLDAAVKAARNEQDPDQAPFADVEPYPEPIDPAQLLSDISAAIRQFIILDTEQAHAAALWIAACWVVDVIHCSPICLINAPEKACGKTQLLTVLGKLVPRPAQASGITPSVLFRMIEAYQPTLLIDEIETVLTKENEDLRGLVNAGHTRDSAYVWRSVAKGDDWEPRRFSVWGMKAIAGINADRLAETVTSRSIIINLRKKLPHEKVTRLRHAEPVLFKMLKAKLARFAADYSQQIRLARPILPDALSDRAQDNWEPLMTIAGCAGAQWMEHAKTAALTLSGTSEKTVSTANELLADIQHVFESKLIDEIGTTNLINALCEDEECRWATYNRGKPISPRQVAGLLKGYSIASKDVRIGHSLLKGFEKAQFADTFSRYLSDPANVALHPLQTPEPNTHKPLDVADSSKDTIIQYAAATLKPASTLDCSAVADKTTILGDDGVPNLKDDDNSSSLRI